MVQRYEQKRRLQWYKCGAAYFGNKKNEGKKSKNTNSI